MRKALHIIDSFGTGGAETWLLEVARYLQRNPELGWKVDFLATGGEKAVYDDAVLEAGAKIFYFKYSMKTFVQFSRFFKALMEKEGYDVIHDHQDFVSGWHFLFGITRLPAVRISHLHNPYNFVHNYVVNPFRWFSFKGGRILTAILTSRITGTSNAVMDAYGYNKWPFRSKRAKPVYCGFEVAKFQYDLGSRTQIRKELGWNDDKIKIALFVGRIGLQKFDTAKNQKNPEFAFEMAQFLVKKDANWRFIFVGYKGETGAAMEANTIEERLEDKIKFLGLRKDVPAIMSASDVLVFPSFWEGLGMVAVEAQAAGLPVILSDSIPKEAVVIEGLVTSKSLMVELKDWVNEVIELGEKKADREFFANKIEASSFSIGNSVAGLIGLYMQQNEN